MFWLNYQKKIMTIEECLNNSIKKLLKSKSPKCDVEVLLSFVIKKKKSFLICYRDKNLSKEEEKKFNNLLKRRIQGEPISYLTGTKEFWSLPLLVNPYVLIPRQDSEILVEEVLNKSNKCSLSVLDLGTGSGALSLALASSRPNWNILGVDINNEAISIAAYNAKQLGLKNVKFIQSNWFSSIGNNTFDFIISNPPYLSSKEIKLFSENIKFEPLNSILSGDNGLKDIKHIILNSQQYLNRNGWLVIEHGWKQKKLVKKLFKENAYIHIYSRKDYGRNDRIVVGKKNF